MSQLPPCRRDIFEHGVLVGAGHSAGAENFEAFCRAVRAWSECPDVDWSYIGGRAAFQAVGDEATLARVREAIRLLAPAINRLVREEYADQFPEDAPDPVAMAVRP